MALPTVLNSFTPNLGRNPERVHWVATVMLMRRGGRNTGPLTAVGAVAVATIVSALLAGCAPWLAANPQFQSRDLKITLYCKTSGRAALCAMSLKKMGYLNVNSIAGGFDAWQAAGFHVDKPAATSFE